MLIVSLLSCMFHQNWMFSVSTGDYLFKSRTHTTIDMHINDAKYMIIQILTVSSRILVVFFFKFFVTIKKFQGVNPFFVSL